MIDSHGSDARGGQVGGGGERDKAVLGVGGRTLANWRAAKSEMSETCATLFVVHGAEHRTRQMCRIENIGFFWDKTEIPCHSRCSIRQMRFESNEIGRITRM